MKSFSCFWGGVSHELEELLLALFLPFPLSGSKQTVLDYINLSYNIIQHSIYDVPASRTARECNINNLMVYALKDQLTEFSYTASTAGKRRRRRRRRREGDGRRKQVWLPRSQDFPSCTLADKYSHFPKNKSNFPATNKYGCSSLLNWLPRPPAAAWSQDSQTIWRNCSLNFTSF